MTAPVPLAVTTWGDGARRALLLHGLSSNAAGWWRLGPDLAERGFTVTAPDLRGHGHSPKADDYAIPSYAADVMALGSGWDLVVGHSLGGAITVQVAAGRPEWAARLVLEDPALVLAATAEVVAWLLEPFSGPMSAASVQADNPGWHVDDCRHKAAALRQCGPDPVRGTVEHNDPWDVRPALAEVAVPTLLMGADPARDALVGPDVAAAALAANPCVSYVAVPGTGHSIHRDDYEAFVAALGPLG